MLTGLYAYANGNPLIFVDGDGMKASRSDCFMARFTVAATLVAGPSGFMERLGLSALDRIVGLALGLDGTYSYGKACSEAIADEDKAIDTCMATMKRDACYDAEQACKARRNSGQEDPRCLEIDKIRQTQKACDKDPKDCPKTDGLHGGPDPFRPRPE